MGCRIFLVSLAGKFRRKGFLLTRMGGIWIEIQPAAPARSVFSLLCEQFVKACYRAAGIDVNGIGKIGVVLGSNFGELHAPAEFAGITRRHAVPVGMGRIVRMF